MRLMLLLQWKKNKAKEEIQTIMWFLLDEFCDVMPNENSSGLPPVKENQRCIDFQPDASIPNKIAYPMSSKEMLSS